MARRAALSLAALLATAAAVTLIPEDGKVGTFRHVDSAHRWRRLRSVEAGDAYEHQRDTHDFAGPVPGRGFVEHSHDVVFANTTAFSDDFAATFARVGCTRLAGEERAGAYPWMAHLAAVAAAGRSGPAADPARFPKLPGEDEALASRIALALTVSFVPELAEEAGAAFAHRLHRAAHLILGDATMAASPQCVAATAGINPVFRVHAVQRLPAPAAVGGPGFRLVLVPAGLLEPFASAHWRTKEDPNVTRAMAERGLSWDDFAHPGGRRLMRIGLKQDGWNWVQSALHPGSMGHVDYPVLEMVPALQNDAFVGLRLLNSYYYYSLGIEISLDLCLYFYVDLWLFRVGIGPLGIGCRAIDYERVANERGARGFHFRFLAAVVAEAGARLQPELYPVNGAQVGNENFVAETQDMGLAGDADERGQARVVYLAGLPLVVSTSWRMAMRLAFAGRLRAGFEVGSWGRTLYARYGILYDSEQADRGLQLLHDHSNTPMPDTEGWILPAHWDDDFALRSVRLTVEPRFLVTFFLLLPFDAVAAVRVQTDIDAVAKDAVACDLPVCMRAGSDASMAAQRGFYATLQLRFRFVIGEMTVRAIFGQLSIPIVSWLLDKLIPATWRLWPETVLIRESAITPRLPVLALCLPVASAARRKLPALPAPGDSDGGARRLQTRILEQPLRLGYGSSGESLAFDLPLYSSLIVPVEVADGAAGFQLGLTDDVDGQRYNLMCMDPLRPDQPRPEINFYLMRVATDITRLGPYSQVPRAYGPLGDINAPVPYAFGIGTPGSAPSPDRYGVETTLGALYDEMAGLQAARGADAAAAATYYVEIVCANGPDVALVSRPECAACQGYLSVNWARGQPSPTASPGSSRTGTPSPSASPSRTPDTASPTPSSSITPTNSRTPSTTRSATTPTPSVTPAPVCDYTIRNGKGDDDMPSWGVHDSASPTPSGTPAPSPRPVRMERLLVASFAATLRLTGLPRARLDEYWAQSDGTGTSRPARSSIDLYPPGPYPAFSVALLDAVGKVALLGSEAHSLVIAAWRVAADRSYLDFTLGFEYWTWQRTSRIQLTDVLLRKGPGDIAPADVVQYISASEGGALVDFVETMWHMPAGVLLDIQAAIRGRPEPRAGQAPQLVCDAGADPAILAELGGAAACVRLPGVDNANNVSTAPIRFLPLLKALYARQQGVSGVEEPNITWRGTNVTLLPALLPGDPPLPADAAVEPLRYITPQLNVAGWSIKWLDGLGEPLPGPPHAAPTPAGNPAGSAGIIAGFAVGGALILLAALAAGLYVMRTRRRGAGAQPSAAAAAAAAAPAMVAVGSDSAEA